MMKQKKKITVANVVDYLETLCSTNYVFLKSYKANKQIHRLYLMECHIYSSPKSIKNSAI